MCSGSTTKVKISHSHHKDRNLLFTFLCALICWQCFLQLAHYLLFRQLLQLYILLCSHLRIRRCNHSARRGNTDMLVVVLFKQAAVSCCFFTFYQGKVKIRHYFSYVRTETYVCQCKVGLMLLCLTCIHKRSVAVPQSIAGIPNLFWMATHLTKPPRFCDTPLTVRPPPPPSTRL
jgi:hypothetical protein